MLSIDTERLQPEALFQRCDPAQFKFNTTAAMARSNREIPRYYLETSARQLASHPEVTSQPRGLHTLKLTNNDVQAVVIRQRAELERRERLYPSGRPHWT